MNRLKLQGRVATPRDQLRAATTRKIAPAALDPAAFGGEFVGPPTPRHILLSRLPSCWEITRHWRVAADLKRFGQVEQSQTSAPYLGDAFGYGQTPQEV